MSTDVFISYSSQDAAAAESLCAALEGAGLSCWIAPRNISPGQTWSEAIMDGINGSEILVLLYTGASNDSPQVLREVERAVSKRLGLITFRRENILPGKAMEYLVSVSHWQEAYTGPLDPHLPALVQSVQTLLASRKAGPHGPNTGLPSGARPADAPVRPAHNLPRQTTRFIGREKETAEVRELLADSPLLTLMGTGGCGKTRLSLQVADAVLEEYPNGCWLVELAPLTDPALVPRTVAAIWGLREEPNRDLLQTLTDYLASKKLLLVLDNCEHLIEAGSRLADTVLKSCPEVRILATSREALRIQGEAIYRLPSLSVPDPEEWGAGPRQPALERLAQYESVSLFTDRARLRKPDFMLTAANAPALAQLCCHLDGIPLALELAAARIKALTVEQIASRLDDRFRLLAGGSRMALPRQQTLRALIDWSYDLLTDPEKTLLHRLSVFSGGWTLEAAEAVCAGEDVEEWEVLDILCALIDKSLVVAEEQEDETRYRLLETLRQYGREKLEESGERAAVQARHLAWYLQLAEEADKQIREREEVEGLERLEREHANLRSALDSAQTVPEGAEAELRLASALSLFWRRRGYFHEGRMALAHALERVKADRLEADCARALMGAGILAEYQADYAGARALYEECLHLMRQKGDRRNEATVLNNLGIVARLQGDYPTAYALYEQSLMIRKDLQDRRGVGDLHANIGNLEGDQGNYESAFMHFEACRAIFREIGDQEGEAHALLNMGYAAFYQEQYKVALPFLQESLQMYRKLSDKRGIALVLTNIGSAMCEQGEVEAARAALVQSLTLFQQLGFQRGIAYALDAFARIAHKQKKTTLALRTYGAAEGLRERLGLSLPPSERPRHTRYISEAGAEADETVFAACRSEGRNLSTEQMIRMALED